MTQRAEKSKDEKCRDEKMIDKTFICLKCFFRVPKIDFVYEKNKKMLVYACQCGAQYCNTISSYITALAKLRIQNEIKGKCSSKLHPEATASFFCFQCQKAFCDDCIQYHNEYNKSHYTVEKKKPKILNMCFAHNIPNKFYCSGCNSLCCELCKGKHANHSMTNIYKEKSNYNKGELSQKEKVLTQIDEYIKYVEDVNQIAKGNYENLFGDQPGNYFEDAIKRLNDEERLIQLMYNNISIEPENIMSYINLNTIEKIFPLHIIKDEINKFDLNISNGSDSLDNLQLRLKELNASLDNFISILGSSSDMSSNTIYGRYNKASVDLENIKKFFSDIPEDKTAVDLINDVMGTINKGV